MSPHPTLRCETAPFAASLHAETPPAQLVSIENLSRTHIAYDAEHEVMRVSGRGASTGFAAEERRALVDEATVGVTSADMLPLCARAPPVHGEARAPYVVPGKARAEALRQLAAEGVARARAMMIRATTTIS